MVAVTAGSGGTGGGGHERDVLVVPRRSGERGAGYRAEAGYGKRQSPASEAVSRHGGTVAIAAATFAVAVSGGGYSLGVRATTATLAWSAVVVAVAVRRPARTGWAPAFAIGGLLLALAVVTGLSIARADSAERAFIELDRVLMYLGIFAAVCLLQRPGDTARWVVGLGAGIAGVCVLAFAGRCFPSLGITGSLHTLLPSVDGRLAYPMGYWNGVGIFAALGLPLLASTATGARSPLARAVAIAPLPVIAGVVYLTSSRGGVAVAALGAVALLALAPRRIAVFATFAVAAAGSALVVAALVPRHALVDHPGSAAAASQGHRVAVIALLTCAATGLLHAIVSSSRVRDMRLSRRAAAAVTVVAILAAAGGAIAADPSRRFHEFKSPPAGTTHIAPDFIRQHLLSASGSGRWQFWTAALSEFRSKPLAGHGAGSYEAWFTQHGPIAYYVRDAHSLWLQTLGELGLLGLIPLACAFVLAVVVGARRLAGRAPDARMAPAALLAALLAWILGASLDWIWQLTAVGAIGVVCLALLSGPASRTGAEPATLAFPEARPGRAARGAGLPAIAAMAVVAIAIGCAVALPWLVQREIRASQAAVRSHDLADATRRALGARSLQPWAASPYLQLALIDETRGDLRSSISAIRQATKRDPGDWRLWLVYTRVATQAGRIRAARKALAHVRELNPRSPLFAQGATG